MPRLSKSAIENARQDVAAQRAIAAQRVKLIDEYGRLDAELAPIKSKVKRQADLGKLIREWFKTEDPASTFTAQGESFEVVVSAAGMQTHLAKATELYEAIGHEKFLRAASVTLCSLEAQVDGSLVAALTTKKRTGPRTLIVKTKTAA